MSSDFFRMSPNGEVQRIPTTMRLPPTWRESMLGRRATSTDIIGVEVALKDADELRELRRQFEYDDNEGGIEDDIDY
jgi:hypothetical protein